MSRRHPSVSRVYPARLLSLLTLLGGACSGEIGESDLAPAPGEPSPGESPAPGRTGPPSATPAGSAGSASYALAINELRRLTRREYDNTVRDLLGDASQPARAFPDDPPGPSGYAAPGATGSLEFDAYMQAAEKLAVNAQGRLATLLPCAPKTAAEEEPCATAFIKSFAARAYRRPLLAEETADLQTLYRDVRQTAALTFPEAIGAVIQGVLQSPSFLYHRERGGDRPAVEGDAVRFTNYELASRLSYFIAGTMPDTMLLEAAAAAKLSSVAELETHARRLALQLPVLTESLSDFSRQWLDLDTDALEKNKDIYPEFAAVKALLPAEMNRFVADLVGQGLPPQALFTEPAVYANRTSAKVYGLASLSSDQLTRVAAPAGQRAGVFTQLAFLAVHATAAGSHPVKRGVVMLERVLCGVLPPPPPDVPAPKPPQPNQTTRERFAEHSSNECASCHKAIDPLGFAFESYDGIGRFRTTEAGRPVDASGNLTLPSGDQVDFKSAVDLLPKLAASSDARSCLARQLARYGTQAPEGLDVDPAKEMLAAPAAAAKLTELYLSVVRSRPFRFRKLSPGEVL